jgi:hypothetical protein
MFRAQLNHVRVRTKRSCEDHDTNEVQAHLKKSRFLEAGVKKAGIFKSTKEKEWAIEITFDGGRKTQTKDLRPDLPLIIHY